MADTVDTPAPGHTVGVPLAAAAAALGTSERTVLRRIARGELRGERVAAARGKVWRVYLNGVAARPERQVSGTTDTPARPAAGMSDTADTRVAAPPNAPLEKLVELIDRLEREKATAQVAAAHWQARAQAAEDTLQKLLMAPKDAPVEATLAARAEERRKPWWRRWFE